jgi:hypothetical protein
VAQEDMRMAVSRESARDEWEWTMAITKMLKDGIRGSIKSCALASSPSE